MFRASFAICLLAFLSACGDPLAGVARLSEVELSDDDPAVAAALPTEEEIAREGFFGTEAVEGVQSPVEAAVPVDAEPPQRGGLLGLLRRMRPEATPEMIMVEDTPVILEETATGEATDQVAVSDDDTVEDAPIVLAAVDETVAPAPRRRGLFSRLTGTSAAAPGVENALPEVEYGTKLPFGVIARTCASKRQPLGRKVETASARGYKLYDSNPRTNAPRTFYITGFDDGCPRQVTASHVLFGAPSFYELLRFGPGGDNLTKGETDKAYDKVKSRICGARAARPCGGKMKQMERDTFFINSYPRSDDNTSWSEMLIHDGEVMATALKSSS